MSRALTPSLEVRSAILMSRERELPIPGEVLVAVGDAVGANTVVARTYLPGALMIERLPEKLGFTIAEVMKGLRVKEGDFVKKGDLLFEHRGLWGLFTTRFNSEYEGQVELISITGHVAIRLASRAVEIKSFIKGKVAAVSATRSATIEAQAAWVQGIFGVGGERIGVVQIINEEKINFNTLGDLQGKILIYKFNPQGRDLQEAMQRGATGFVCGSIDDRALKDFLGFELGVALTGDEPISMSLIITEGFGEIPMSELPWKLLAKHQGQEASINGTTQVRAGAQRPEVIISLSASEQATEVSLPIKGNLQIGSAVRVIRYPYFGKKGLVTELPSELVQIATGAEMRVLKVSLEEGGEIIVPRTNVEIVVS